MGIGKRLKKWRVLRGLTQQELADLTNYSERTINRIENGADAKMSFVEKYCGALGIKVWKALKHDPGDKFDKKDGERGKE